MWFIIGALFVIVLFLAWHVVLIVANNIDLTNKTKTDRDVILKLNELVNTCVEYNIYIMHRLETQDNRLKKLEVQSGFYCAEAGSD